jgi:hypothetical protein
VISGSCDTERKLLQGTRGDGSVVTNERGAIQDTDE